MKYFLFIASLLFIITAQAQSDTIRGKPFYKNGVQVPDLPITDSSFKVVNSSTLKKILAGRIGNIDLTPYLRSDVASNTYSTLEQYSDLNNNVVSNSTAIEDIYNRFATIAMLNDFLLKGDTAGLARKVEVDTAKVNLRAEIAASTGNGNTALLKAIRDSLMAGALINIKWFNPNVGDSVTPAIAAFTAAKALSAAWGNRAIYFPAGYYPAVDANGWLIGQSNVHLIGDGESTVLLPAAGQVFGGLQMAPYRDAGWQNQPAQVYTYEDSAAIGQDYIVMKVGQDLSLLTPGTQIFINDGASHYDQLYGEHNVVYKVQGRRVYLKDNLSRDYTAARGSWAATVAQSFVMPDSGQTVTVTLTGEVPSVTNAYGISINNNLFQVTATTATTATITNMGKGNAASGTVINAGAAVMKGREVIIASSVVHDVTVENMTVIGRRKALNVSNSYNTTFKNVHFKWLPASDGGGWTIDGDDGKYATLDHCIVEAPFFWQSQLARSFTGFEAINTTFHNASIDFTEFATGEIANCTFEEGMEIDSVERLPNSPAITIGASSANINIHHNTFRLSNRIAAISNQPDIQTYVGQSGNGITLDNNTIYCNNCTYAINVVRNGAITISNNKIFGSVNYLFSVDGMLYADTSNQRNRGTNWFNYINTCKIINNSFGGYLDGLSSRIWHNVEFVGNDINRFDSLSVANSNNANALGNVLRGTDTLPIQRLIVKNNTFRHWNLNSKSFNIPAMDSLHMDISLNYFYDNVGTGAKDSIVTVFTPYDNRYNKGGGTFTGVTVNTGKQVQFFENADGSISIQLVQSTITGAMTSTEGNTLTTTEGDIIITN